MSGYFVAEMMALMWQRILNVISPTNAGDHIDLSNASKVSTPASITLSPLGGGASCADGTIGAGDATLTSASNPFLPAHVGQAIHVPGAGAGGIDLLTTILSFTSAGEVELTVAATVAVGPVTVVWALSDTAQRNAALATGKWVYLAPGDWMLDGEPETTTQTRELVGPTPHGDGVINLSYAQAITLESSDATGRYALNTYDATFNGVVDHTSRWGFNNGAGGQAHDATLHEWGIQLETNYNSSPVGPIISEWFLQYRSVGAGLERRPVFVTVNQATNASIVAIAGQVDISTEAGQARLGIPNTNGECFGYGTWSFVKIGGGNNFKVTDTWIAAFNHIYLWTKKLPLLFIDTAGTGYCQLMLNGSDEFCIGTTDANSGAEATHVPAAVKLGAAILWPSYVTTPGITQAAADLGHDTAPSDIHLQAQNNTHADTPLKGNIHALSPVIFPSVTDAEEAALTPVAGMVVYNTTDSKLRVYSGGAWVDLH